MMLEFARPLQGWTAENPLRKGLPFPVQMLDIYIPLCRLYEAGGTFPFTECSLLRKGKLKSCVLNHTKSSNHAEPRIGYDDTFNHQILKKYRYALP